MPDLLPPPEVEAEFDATLDEYEAGLVAALEEHFAGRERQDEERIDLGTTEGALKSWDTRGRGEHVETPARALSPEHEAILARAKVVNVHALYERARTGGGLTFSVARLAFPTKGFVVSTRPDLEQSFKGDISEELLKAYIDRVASELTGDRCLGAWLDAEKGNWYLDVVRVLDSREEAIALGRAHNQEGIFDLERQETVIIKAAHERRDEDAGRSGRVFVRLDPKLMTLAEMVEVMRAIEEAVSAAHVDSAWEDQPRDEFGRWVGTGAHPKPDDHGRAVRIAKPTRASSKSSWTNPAETATFVPRGQGPASLNGVPVAPWSDAPRTRAEWAALTEGTSPEFDLPFEPLPGKKTGAGVLIVEPDGRIWLTRPTNAYGGYWNSFPKGTAEPGLTLQQNAIKEAYEETGLKVEITGVLGDYERDTSYARMFIARRVGGTPAEMGWESQAVRLAPFREAAGLLNRWHDRNILGDLAAVRATRSDAEPWEDVPREENGRWTGSGAAAQEAHEELKAKIAGLEAKGKLTPGLKAHLTKLKKALAAKESAGKVAATTPAPTKPPKAKGGAAPGSLQAVSQLTPPDPGDLEFVKSGKDLGGAGYKDLYEDQSGQRWMFKAATLKGSTAAKPYAAEAQVAFANIAREVRSHLPVAKATVTGPDGTARLGTLQPMLSLGDPPNLAKVAPEHLTEAEALDVATEHVLDWLTSNHDTHGGNLVRTSDGHVLGIDKEQGWRYFGKDRLTTDYAPNEDLYGEQPPYYNRFWSDWAAGWKKWGRSKVKLDPQALEPVIAKVEAIPSEKYAAMIRPYAAAVTKAFPRPKAQEDAFVAAAVKRKERIRSEFEGFIGKLRGSPFKFVHLDAGTSEGAEKAWDTRGRSSSRAGEHAPGQIPERLTFLDPFDVGGEDPVTYFRGHQPQAEWQNNLSPAEYHALDSYQGAAYSWINSQLRSGYEPGTEAKTLSAIIDRSPPIPEEVVVWRGFRHPELAKDPASFLSKSGDLFRDDGFVSTTIDMAIARGFTLEHLPASSVLMRITLPKGTKAPYLTGFGTGEPGGENEYLLQRSATFQITGFSTTKDGYRIVEATYLGSRPRTGAAPTVSKLHGDAEPRTERFGWSEGDVVFFGEYRAGSETPAGALEAWDARDRVDAGWEGVERDAKGRWTSGGGKLPDEVAAFLKAKGIKRTSDLAKLGPGEKAALTKLVARAIKAKPPAGSSQTEAASRAWTPGQQAYLKSIGLGLAAKRSPDNPGAAAEKALALGGRRKKLEQIANEESEAEAYLAREKPRIPDTPPPPMKKLSFKSVADAEKMARSLGVKAVDLDGDLVVATRTLEGLAQAKAMGLKMPLKLLAPADGGKEVMGYDLGDTPALNTGGYIVISNQGFHSNFTSNQWAFGKGIVAERDLQRQVVHECGHLNHSGLMDEPAVKEGTTWKKKALPSDLALGARKKLTDAEAKIAKSVSSYACTSRAEFVAEVVGGVASGKKFDARVRALYSRFGGPRLSW